jgi:hypothetical protein
MTMKKSYFKTVLVAFLIVIGLLTVKYAPTASADEQSFIDSIDAVGHYSTIYPDQTVQIGQQVCTIFDNGSDSEAAVDWVLKKYNGPGNGPNEPYYATLFAQSAAYELCPEHNGEIGQI